MKISTFTLTIIATAVATLAHAQTGTIGFNDNGVPSDNDPANVAAATSFTIGDFTSGGDVTGAFAGLPDQNFGALSLSLSSPTSFDFISPTFGSFICNTVSVLDSTTDHNIEIIATGTYTGGTWDPGISSSASLDVIFDQSSVGNGLSDTSEFSIPAVPEPGSLALLGAGATGLCVFLRRRNA